ncbi:MAG: tripartite tricarboxylate transporter permease [Beijerinckiaceae bacterium]|jgi:putative tricarboxylic transport membrane protein|nr:tripartite tricarboxylate transporter permease [Beijerinckiaceae bacterium]
MIDQQAVAAALAQLLTLSALKFLLIGTVIGLVFGVIPGLGGTTAIALLTPITFSMEKFDAIILMAGIMASTPTSGAVTAILINTPGTAPNAATCLDGYPMAKQGKAGLAIGASSMASGIGGLLGIAFLIAVIPITREIVLLFKPPEFFLLAILGLVSVAVSTQDRLLRGLIVGGFGLLISFIGYESVTGEVRYDFGLEYLWDGLKLVPAMIGLFAIAEMINLWAKGGSVVEDPSKQTIDFKQVLAGCWAPFQHWGTTLRGSAIGTLIGALPGVGGTVAAFLAYTVAIGVSKDPQSFGKGNIIGVIAPESANNAKEGGSLVPTLAFGIPGSAEMAVFLGVLVLHGLAPGPTIVIEHMDIIWTLILSLTAAGVLASIITLGSARWLAKLTLIDSRTLVPVVIAFALIGSYSLNNEILDVFVSLGFGVVGFVFMRLGFPRLTLPIALVLGQIMETSYLQSLRIGDGTLKIFLASWPSRILVLCILLSIFLPALKFLYTKMRSAPVAVKG